MNLFFLRTTSFATLFVCYLYSPDMIASKINEEAGRTSLTLSSSKKIDADFFQRLFTRQYKDVQFSELIKGDELNNRIVSAETGKPQSIFLLAKHIMQTGPLTPLNALNSLKCLIWSYQEALIRKENRPEGFDGLLSELQKKDRIGSFKKKQCKKIFLDIDKLIKNQLISRSNTLKNHLLLNTLVYDQDDNSNVEPYLTLEEKKYKYSSFLENITADQMFYLGSTFGKPKYIEIAAQKGHRKAHRQMAYMYLQGVNFKKNLKQARFWFEQIQSPDDSEDLYYLGVLHQDFEAGVVNQEIARDFFKRSAEKGHMLAQHNYGISLLNGIGGPQDIDLAIEFLKQAEQHGDHKVESALYEVYLDSKYGKNDDEKGRLYVKEKADKGIARAQHYYGMMLVFGRGGHQDIDLGLHYIEQALEQKDYRTYYTLYSIYATDTFGKKNDDLALLYLYKAALQDLPEALLGLAFHYYQEGNKIEHAEIMLYKALNSKEVTEEVAEACKILLEVIEKKDTEQLTQNAYLGLVEQQLKGVVDLQDEIDEIADSIQEDQDDREDDDIDASSHLSEDFEELNNSDKELALDLMQSPQKNKKLKLKPSERRKKKQKEAVLLSLSKRSQRALKPTATVVARKQLALNDITFSYINGSEEEKFAKLYESNEKLRECLSGMLKKPYATEGAGKPEVLKNLYRGLKGAISRRLDHENRFIYKVTGPGQILVLDFVGHYDNKKESINPNAVVQGILGNGVEPIVIEPGIGNRH